MTQHNPGDPDTREGRLQAENEKLRAALAPFARIAPAVERTDLRDGEVVHRQQFGRGGNVEWLELTKDDFRRASKALTPSTESNHEY